jgi:hypothetical protein
MYTKKRGETDFTGSPLSGRRKRHYSAGLLLQPVVGKDSEYRRVGLVHGSRNPDASLDYSAWFDRLSNVEDIVII